MMKVLTDLGVDFTKKEHTHYKFQSKGFMDLIVETWKVDEWLHVSVAHYYVQEGDLMVDPAIKFLAINFTVYQVLTVLIVNLTNSANLTIHICQQLGMNCFIVELLNQLVEIDTDRANRLKQYVADKYRQNKTYGIPWKSDKLEDFPVYRIPNKILSYNFDNARLAAEKNSEEGKLSRLLDPKNPNDQKIVQRILLTSVWFDKKDTEQLKKSLEVQQRTPAIVTFDGVIIDGNRRFACLNTLHEEKGNPQYTELDICILPQASKKELIILENRLQLAKDYKVDYGPINDRLRLREMRRNKDFEMEEIIYSVNGRYKAAEIEKMVEEMDLIDNYLDQIGRPKDYASIAGKTESFSNLLNALNIPVGQTTTAKAAVEREKIKLLGFQLISHPESTYVHMRKFRDVLKKPQARKELIENSYTYNNFGKAKPFELERLNDEWDNLDLAYGFVTKLKSDPRKLAHQALQKLELIDLERLPTKNIEFTNVLKKISDRIEKLKKKMG